MQLAEICPLTKKAVETLLHERHTVTPPRGTKGRRRTQRWPFPGTVELWVPEGGGTEHHALATSLDLSIDGVGIRCDEPLPPGTALNIAIHEPEVSFHGRAVVRHCTAMGPEYLVGLSFLFSPD